VVHLWFNNQTLIGLQEFVFMDIVDRSILSSTVEVVFKVAGLHTSTCTVICSRSALIDA
jgi:hypothetical protein